MKISVFGNRDIQDAERVLNKFEEVLAELGSNHAWLFGGADGVSRIIKEYLEDKAKDTILFRPWHMLDANLPFSTKLFYLRNKQLVSNSDIVLVLVAPGDLDNEVASAIRLADRIGVQVVKHYI